MCRKANKTVDYHLFLFCFTANFLWNKTNFILKRDGTFENLNSLIALILNHNTMSRKGMISFNLLVAFIWSIWLEKNKRLFRNTISNANNLWDDICNLIDLWLSKGKLFLRIILPPLLL